MQEQAVFSEETESHNWQVRREFYRDSLDVLKTEYKNRPNKGKIGYKIWLNLKKEKPIGVYFLFNKTDSLVNQISISRPDTLRYTNAKGLFTSKYKIPTSFTESTEIDLDGEDKLTISFYDKYFMKQILYQWHQEDGDWVNTVVNFDYRNTIVDYGSYYPHVARICNAFDLHGV